MLRLYLDEDAQQSALVAALRRLGFDCLTVDMAGRRGGADDDQLEFATAEDRVLYTKNTRDFVRLHASWLRTGKHHGGVIVLTDQTLPVGAQSRAFERLASVLTQKAFHDRLEFLLNHIPRTGE